MLFLDLIHSRLQYGIEGGAFKYRIYKITRTFPNEIGVKKKIRDSYFPLYPAEHANNSASFYTQNTVFSIVYSRQLYV